MPDIEIQDSAPNDSNDEDDMSNGNTNQEYEGYETASEGPGIRRPGEQHYRMDESDDHEVDEVRELRNGDLQRDDDGGMAGGLPWKRFEDDMFDDGRDWGRDDVFEERDGNDTDDCEVTPTQTRQEFNSSTLAYAGESDGHATGTAEDKTTLGPDMTILNLYAHLPDIDRNNPHTGAQFSQVQIAPVAFPSQPVFVPINLPTPQQKQKIVLRPRQRDSQVDVGADRLEDDDDGTKAGLAARTTVTYLTRKRRKMDDDEAYADNPISRHPQIAQPRRPTQTLVEKNRTLNRKLLHSETHNKHLLFEGRGLYNILQEREKEVMVLTEKLKEHENPEGSFQQTIVGNAVEEQLALKELHQRQLENLQAESQRQLEAFKAENERKELEFIEKRQREILEWQKGVEAKFVKQKMEIDQAKSFALQDLTTQMTQREAELLLEIARLEEKAKQKDHELQRLQTERMVEKASADATMDDERASAVQKELRKIKGKGKETDIRESGPNHSHEPEPTTPKRSTHDVATTATTSIDATDRTQSPESKSNRYPRKVGSNPVLLGPPKTPTQTSSKGKQPPRSAPADLRQPPQHKKGKEKVVSPQQHSSPLYAAQTKASTSTSHSPLRWPQTAIERGSWKNIKKRAQKTARHQLEAMDVDGDCEDNEGDANISEDENNDEDGEVESNNEDDEKADESDDEDDDEADRSSERSDDDSPRRRKKTARDDDGDEPLRLTRNNIMNLIREALADTLYDGYEKKHSKRRRGRKVNVELFNEKKKDVKWQRKAFCDLVNATMKELFGVEEMEDFALLDSVSEEEIQEFVQTGGKGPNLENLQMDMKGKISSDWNIAVLECLVNAVEKKAEGGTAFRELPKHSKAYFEEIILTQMEKARGIWQNTQPRILHNGHMETLEQVEERMKEQKDASAKANRVRTRRTSRYHRRLSSLDRIIEQKEQDPNSIDVGYWKWLRSLITTLGPDGMSSDDSEVDRRTGQKLLIPRIQKWRRPMENELGIIDDLREDSEMNVSRSRGSTPVVRERERAEKPTRRKPPKNIPKTLFEAYWLENHPDKSRLKISDKKFVWMQIMRTRGRGGRK